MMIVQEQEQRVDCTIYGFKATAELHSCEESTQFLTRLLPGCVMDTRYYSYNNMIQVKIPTSKALPWFDWVLILTGIISIVYGMLLT